MANNYVYLMTEEEWLEYRKDHLMAVDSSYPSYLDYYVAKLQEASDNNLPIVTAETPTENNFGIPDFPGLPASPSNIPPQMNAWQNSQRADVAYNVGELHKAYLYLSEMQDSMNTSIQNLSSLNMPEDFDGSSFNDAIKCLSGDSSTPVKFTEALQRTKEVRNKLIELSGLTPEMFDGIFGSLTYDEFVKMSEMTEDEDFANIDSEEDATAYVDKYGDIIEKIFGSALNGLGIGMADTAVANAFAQAFGYNPIVGAAIVAANGVIISGMSGYGSECDIRSALANALYVAQGKINAETVVSDKLAQLMGPSSSFAAGTGALFLMNILCQAGAIALDGGDINDVVNGVGSQLPQTYMSSAMWTLTLQACGNAALKGNICAAIVSTLAVELFRDPETGEVDQNALAVADIAVTGAAATSMYFTAESFAAACAAGETSTLAAGAGGVALGGAAAAFGWALLALGVVYLGYRVIHDTPEEVWERRAAECQAALESIPPECWTNF